jgi:hypothetical protein
VKRLGLAFKLGFKIPVGGSVPVIFSSMAVTKEDKRQSIKSVKV